MRHANLPDAGRIPHPLVDRRLPTPSEKTILEDLDKSILPLTRAVDNTANPPTDAQLDTAFGAPATLGAGFFGILDDNDAATNVYLCYTDGTSWFYERLTKAT